MQDNFKWNFSQKRKNFLLKILVFWILSFTSSPSIGQHWKLLTDPIKSTLKVPTGQTPYFINEKIGFIFSALDSTWLYRTLDSGVTWQKISSIDSFLINQIYFITTERGYLATENGLFETLDTGKSWKIISPDYYKYFYSVYASLNKIFAITKYNSGARLISAKYGSSIWSEEFETHRIPPLNYVFGNRDSLIYANGIDSQGYILLYYSTNEGANWHSNQIGIDPTFPWDPKGFLCTNQCHDVKGLFCFPHCDGILETFSFGDLYLICHSSDYGNSWDTLHPGAEIGAWIAGNSCALYVSNASDNPSAVKGLLRSTDYGRTWQNIRGPDFTELDDFDFHNLCVHNNSAVVYATDINGKLWKTADGGDGSLSSSLKPPFEFFQINDPFLRLDNDTLKSELCDTVPIKYFFQDFSCNHMNLAGVNIDGLDSGEYSIFVSLPNSFCNNFSNTLRISIFPKTLATRKVTIHFYTDDLFTLDTSITFYLKITQTQPSIMSINSDQFTPTGVIDFGTGSFCLGKKDTILLSNPSCYGLAINKIWLETDSLSQKDFSLSEQSPYFLSKITSPNKLIIGFHPLTPGFKLGKIIIATSTGNDTIPIYGNAIPDSTTLVIKNSDTINFGAKPLCLGGGKDTLTLSNPGCFDIKIKNIRFVPDATSPQDFSITTSGPITLNADASARKIFINYNPQTSGVKSGIIIIETDLKTDTIPVYANVIADARTLLTRCDLLQSPICDSIDGFIHLVNLSCREMTIDSVSLPRPFQLLPIRIPVIIESGDTVTLPVRFIPSQRGSINMGANILVGFTQPTGTIEFDTALTLTGFGTHGTSAYTLSTNAAIFDSLHLCDSAKRRIVLYSTGCDSLPLGSISISGDKDFQVLGFGGQLSELATGDSVVVNISLNPTSTGNKSAAITITLTDSSKVTLPINATVLRAVKTLSSNASGVLDFGKQSICDIKDTTITITNPSCIAVQVTGIGFQGSGFGTSTSFPITIPPGGSTTINLKTILDTTGGKLSNSATLNIISDADNIVSPITLVKSYIYPYPVHLWLDGDKTPLTSAKVWKVKLKGLPNELSKIQTIDLTMGYNTDLLGYTNSTIGGNRISSPDGKSFTILGSPMIISGADSSIAELNFNIYLTKDTATTIVFSSVTLNSSDPKFMDCVSYPLSTGLDFLYLNSCGDRSLRAFKLSKPMKIISMRPNPAQDEIEIDLESAIKQDANIEIRNALGACVYSGAKNLTSGSNSIHLNTKGLASGMYLVRVGDVSKSLVISR